jgi:hypothetical protein
LGILIHERSTFLGLLSDPVGDVSDITGLYVTRDGEPPVDWRVISGPGSSMSGWEDF